MGNRLKRAGDGESPAGQPERIEPRRCSQKAMQVRPAPYQGYGFKWALCQLEWYRGYNRLNLEAVFYLGLEICKRNGLEPFPTNGYVAA